MDPAVNKEEFNMFVKLRKNETVENMIKRFVRKMKKEKILEEYRERQYFKKPSEKRREALERRKIELDRQKREEAKGRDD